MNLQRLLATAVLFLLGAGSAAAQSNIADGGAQDGAWVSYRDAYRQMIRFEKYGKPKHLIQQHYQVSPRDASAGLDGVRLMLTGPATQLHLPLDAAGRAVFPFLKSAYDDNARLLLNRKENQYAMQPRVSIAPRADGIYDAADLRLACEQVLDYLRYAGKPGMQNKHCAGVRFSFARNAGEPVVRLRSGEQVQALLPVEEAAAFQDESGPMFKTITYRFADWPLKGQVVTQTVPAAIAAVFR